MVQNKHKTEYIFLVAITIYIVRALLNSSTFMSFAITEVMCKVVLLLSFALCCAKIVIDFFQKNISKKRLIIIIAGYCVSLIIFLLSKSYTQLYLWTIIAASNGVDFKKIISVAAITLITTLIVILISSQVGLIQNSIITQYRKGIVFDRYGLGFVAYHQTSHYTFYATMMYLWFRRTKVTWPELVALSLLQIFVYHYCDTRLPFYLGILAVGLVFAIKIFKLNEKYIKLYDVCAIAVHPICCAVITALSYIYIRQYPFVEKINTLLSGRLFKGNNAINTFGISLFSNKMEWDIMAPTFVDSSYLRILIDRGIIFTLLILGLFVFEGLLNRKKKDIFFVIFTSLVAIHSMSDGYLLSFACVPLYYIFSFYDYCKE